MATNSYYPPHTYSRSSASIHGTRKQSISAESAISSDHSVSSLRSPSYRLMMSNHSSSKMYPASEYPQSPTNYMYSTTSDYDGRYLPSISSPTSPSASMNERYGFNALLPPLPRPSNYSNMSRSPPSSYYHHGSDNASYERRGSFADEEADTFGAHRSSISTRTTASSTASSDVFPPTEDARQKAIATLKANESLFKVVYAGDISYRPEKGLLNKSKRAHFVLTNNYLLVYKSSQKARSEINIFEHHDDSSAYARSTNKLFDKDRIFLKLSDIYAVHASATTACVFRLEYFHPQSGQALSHSLTADTEKECRQWVQAFRKSIRVHHPHINGITSAERFAVLERLGKQNDTFLDTDEVKVFKVVFKEKRYKAGSDIAKEVFLPIFLVIGKFSFYFLPISVLDDEYLKMVERDRFGFLTLLSIRYENTDDTVILEVKQVSKSNRQLVFASTFCEDIIRYLYRGVESLVPGAASQLYTDRVPPRIKQTQVIPVQILNELDGQLTDSDADEETRRFSVTLQAYCAAMNMNKSRFNFTIMGPPKVKSFTLLPPKEIGQTPPHYEKYELLAIFRILQANNVFVEICLANCSLHALEIWTIQQTHGWVYDKHHPLKDDNLLSNEIYSTLTKLQLLRKLDLTNCSIGKLSPDSLVQQASAISAIATVMRSGNTHVSRLCLGKNTVHETDLKKLIQGIKEHRKSIKELYLNECGLSKDMIESILSTLFAKTPDQLISLDLSIGKTPNPPLLESSLIESLIPNFKRLEYLFMRGFGLLNSVLYRFPLELGHLRELDLSDHPMNSDVVGRACQWILSPSFQTIESLHLGGCNLNGKHVFEILTSISQSGNRTLHLNLENNPIMKEVMHLPKLHSAILQGEGPKSISFARVEWDDCTLHEFIDCLRDNQTIAHLDLSDIVMRDAESISDDTVRMMTSLFERNTSITELEIGMVHHKLPTLSLSSNQHKPMVSDVIIRAMQGLRYNNHLQHLDVSGLNMGDAGALALSRVLKTNRTLQSIIIDENSVCISIEGYRSLLKSIEENAKQVINFPVPRIDIRNQLRFLSFRIEELIISENEAQFFLIHTTASDKKKLKKHELEVVVQERKASEFALKNLEGVIHSLTLVVRKNMKEYEEQTFRNMEFQMQAQNAAQELAIAQVRLQNRSVAALSNNHGGLVGSHLPSRQPSSSAASTTSSATNSVVDSLSRNVSRSPSYYHHSHYRRSTVSTDYPSSTHSFSSAYPEQRAYMPTYSTPSIPASSVASSIRGGNAQGQTHSFYEQPASTISKPHSYEYTSIQSPLTPSAEYTDSYFREFGIEPTNSYLVPHPHSSIIDGFSEDDPGFISDFGNPEDFVQGGFIDAHFTNHAHAQSKTYPTSNSTFDQNEEEVLRRLNRALYLPPDDRA
ncbi:hypothetical protein BD560DRAFT_441526 [Blakeslea trispora]|nr:hypothetical protein BD560DRAFT_441526 [Blakeslea trispora]